MNITVEQLIERLQQLPTDLPVLMSKDNEGNGFRYIQSDSVGLYSFNGNENPYELQVGLDELTDEFKQQGYTEEDIFEKPCVVLW